MNPSRRRFFKFVVLGAVAIPFARLLSLRWGVDAWAAVALPAGQKAVPEDNPVAKALGYKADKKNVDKKKYAAQIKKPDYKKQNCANCVFYAKVNDGWGKCQMITAGLVAAEGWCGSWQKKA